MAAHGGRGGHTAAVVAQRNRQAGRRPMDVRQEIGRDRDPAAPSVFERKRTEFRVKLCKGALHMSKIGGAAGKIGRASCRERGCQSLSIAGVAGSFKKNRYQR